MIKLEIVLKQRYKHYKTMYMKNKIEKELSNKRKYKSIFNKLLYFVKSR